MAKYTKNKNRNRNKKLLRNPLRKLKTKKKIKRGGAALIETDGNRANPEVINNTDAVKSELEKIFNLAEDNVQVEAEAKAKAEEAKAKRQAEAEAEA